MSLASYDAHRRRMQAIAAKHAPPEDMGRVSVNWAAVVYGAAVALYVGGLIWLLTWAVPEVLEFTR